MNYKYPPSPPSKPTFIEKSRQIVLYLFNNEEYKITDFLEMVPKEKHSELVLEMDVYGGYVSNESRIFYWQYNDRTEYDTKLAEYNKELEAYKAQKAEYEIWKATQAREEKLQTFYKLKAELGL